MGDSASRRVAVIYNPTKVADGFAERVTAALGAAGWDDPLLLETAADDPGRAMTAQARDTQVDRVVVAGGDGTVRVVASGLADSGISLGVIPAGTGNLLARNLGIPLKEAAALELAVSDQVRTIDLIEIRADEREPEHFAVLAGMGVDAMIMDEVNPDLKSTIGSAAYFLAAAKALGRLPIELEISIDGGRPRRRKAMLCAIGNVGKLTGNLTLIPEARPDDGLLDVWVASPHRFTHWLRLLLRVITRRRQRDDRVDQWRGRTVRVTLSSPDTYQLDGDVEGECRSLQAEVRPNALHLCLPAE